ncbi:hypothetical protein [Alistipes onderdonkii]|uniref:hypothetical protein n=1 Tax=Alistipes onderdonkii TaxID=328813 RepID=UPI0018AC8CCB|nr:hypothetical protein [Alistipes onderdonkii]
MKSVKRKYEMIPVFNGEIFKSWFIICIAICTASCSRAVYVNLESVEAIRFFYLPKGVETQHAVCDYRDVRTFTNIVQDTIIYDRKIISQYIGYVNKLRPVKQRNNDFRIYSIIKFKNSDEYFHLGFGENFGVVFEQQQMKDYPKLFRWLHDLLYSAPYNKNLPMHEGENGIIRM